MEGARFDLKTGVPIDAYRDKGYLRIRVRFASATGFGGGRGGGMMGGGMMGGGATMGGGGAMGGGGGGRGRGGGGGRGRGGFGGVAAGGDFGGRDFGGGGDDGGGGAFDGDGLANGNTGLPTLSVGALSRIQTQAQIMGGGGDFGGRDMGGGGGGGMLGLPGIPGAGGGFGGRGGFGGGFGGGRGQSTTITQIQATLMLDRGVLTTYIPIDLQKSRPDSSGWYLLAVPINTMRSTPDAGGSVRRLILTSDADETFYLAQAALVVENGQLTLSVRRTADAIGAQVGEITVRPGPLTLMADVEAGAADPEVTWNFDADNVGLPRTDAPTDMMGGRGMGMGVPGGAEVHGNGEAPGGAAMGGATARGGMGGAGADPRLGGNAQQLGPRIDARGLTATFTYPNEEQDYRVEVTVRDRSGRKKPITSSIMVKVRS